MLLERASRRTHVNERNTAVTSGIPNAISSPTDKNDAAHTHRRSAIWRIFEPRQFKAYFKRARKAAITDEEETAAASETPYKISWPVTPGCPVRYGSAPWINMSFETEQLETIPKAYQGTV